MPATCPAVCGVIDGCVVFICCIVALVLPGWLYVSTGPGSTDRDVEDAMEVLGGDTTICYGAGWTQVCLLDVCTDKDWEDCANAGNKEQCEATKAPFVPGGICPILGLILGLVAALLCIVFLVGWFAMKKNLWFTLMGAGVPLVLAGLILLINIIVFVVNIFAECPGGAKNSKGDDASVHDCLMCEVPMGVTSNGGTETTCMFYISFWLVLVAALGACCGGCSTGWAGWKVKPEDPNAASKGSYNKMDDKKKKKQSPSKKKGKKKKAAEEDEEEDGDEMY